MNINDRTGRLEHKGFIFAWNSEASHWGAEDGRIGFMYSRKIDGALFVIGSYIRKYKNEALLDVMIEAHTQYFYIWANREASNCEKWDKGQYIPVKIDLT